MKFDINIFINSLPDDTRVINIFNKNINYIPDLSRFKNLLELYCHDNFIKELPKILYKPGIYLIFL